MLMNDKNPRDYFKKVREQTQDFEIHRMKKKTETQGSDANDMMSFSEGEFIIQSNVNHKYSDKHFFIDEELEAEGSEGEEHKKVAHGQVIDQELAFTPYPVCEVQVLDCGEESKT